MTTPRAQLWLVGVFACSLFAAAACCILVYMSRAVGSDDISSLLVQLLTVYSIHISVIAGGIFGSRKFDPKPTDAPQPAFTVALGLSILWNALLLWRFVAFCYAGYHPSVDDGADKLISYVDQMSKPTSFLVDGALAFFFSGKS
jgi:hypothetical protein